MKIIHVWIDWAIRTKLSRGKWVAYSLMLYLAMVSLTGAYALHMLSDGGNPDRWHFMTRLYGALVAAWVVAQILINDFRMHDVGVPGLHQAWFLAPTIALFPTIPTLQPVLLVLGFVGTLGLAVVPGNFGSFRRSPLTIL